MEDGLDFFVNVIRPQFILQIEDLYSKSSCSHYTRHSLCFYRRSLVTIVANAVFIWTLRCSKYNSQYYYQKNLFWEFFVHIVLSDKKTVSCFHCIYVWFSFLLLGNDKYFISATVIRLWLDLFDILRVMLLKWSLFAAARTFALFALKNLATRITLNSIYLRTLSNN